MDVNLQVDVRVGRGSLAKRTDLVNIFARPPNKKIKIKMIYIHNLPRLLHIRLRSPHHHCHPEIILSFD